MADLEPGKLFIGGLSHRTTSNTLDEYFAAYGTVVDSTIILDCATNNSRCFGFVQFAEPASAAAVLANKPHKIDGRIIDPKPSIRRTRSKRSMRENKIFVGGIPSNVSESDLQTFFERFGKVAKATIMNQSLENESRRYGFITFLSRSSMECAVEEQFVFMGGERVEVRKALPRDCGIIMNNRVNTNLSHDQNQIGYLTTVCQQCSAYNTSIVPTPYPAWGPPPQGQQWPNLNPQLPRTGEITNGVLKVPFNATAGSLTTPDIPTNGGALIMYVKETKVPCCFGFCYSADLEPMECVTINGNSVYVNDQIELEKIERRDANNRTICSYKPNEHSHDRSNWVLQQETPANSKPKKAYSSSKIFKILLISIACALLYALVCYDTELVRKLLIKFNPLNVF